MVPSNQRGHTAGLRKKWKSWFKLAGYVLPWFWLPFWRNCTSSLWWTCITTETSSHLRAGKAKFRSN
jgi:hypothetical protein